MDIGHLFADERLTGFACIYCGVEPSTREHVPSKVLIDRRYPADLPVVPACADCNHGFSSDEQYLACLVECALSGTTDPERLGRTNIRRILVEQPRLRARLAQSQRIDLLGDVFWEADVGRVRNIVLKLAKGHVAYEFGCPQRDEPNHIGFSPILNMPEDQRATFESRDEEASQLWPEVGCRAFVVAVEEGRLPEDWHELQHGRYRYRILREEGLRVQMILSEYLACEVFWSYSEVN